MSKNAGKQGTPKRGRYLFLCGTPKERCMGSNTNCNHGLQNSIKMHGTPEEAFNCYKRYLVKEGYTVVGSRALQAPNDGPIQILTKKSRFGAKMRNGKEATRNISGRGGVVISC